LSGHRIRRLDEIAPTYDVAVVGAGPAGMSAAIELARHGVSVLVIDDKASPGGQIYHGIASSPLRPDTILGRDYWSGLDLVRRFEAAAIDCLPLASVWQIEGGRTLFVNSAGASRRIEARHIILATGALERPVPIDGWTLPGVMGVGAAQLLLKSSGVLPQGRTVLLGAGPLLWLFASQMIAAGRAPSHVVSLGAREADVPAAAALEFLASGYARKGAALIWTVRRHAKWSSVRRAKIERQGDAFVIRTTDGGGHESEIAADTVLVHQGIVPNLNLTRASGCAVTWDETQACWKPVTGDFGASTIDGIAVAGDGAGISGARGAEHLGHLAALGAVAALGRIDASTRERLSAQPRAQLERERRGRRFLDLFYRPSARMRAGDPDAIVCRCEEVTGQQVREVVRQTHAQGPNQLKAFLRCGMGPCQGRYCSLTVNEIIAQERRVSPADIEPMRIRPPVKPVTLQELAALESTSFKD
jgi:thioredoxin reductase/bacterioferritin-associated ferredoxin